MQDANLKNGLEQILRQQERCTEELLAVLESERKALVQRDVDQLQAAAQAKHTLSERLDTLEANRKELVSSLGLRPDTEAFAQLLDSEEYKTAVRDIWERVIANTARCQDLNLGNGAILEAGRRQTEQLLHLLRGQQPAASVYDPQGSTSASFGRRHLGKV